MKQTALKLPDKIAYKYLKETLTYKELDQKSERLSDFILSLGAKQGDRIGIYLDRCIENAIAVYGR